MEAPTFYQIPSFVKKKTHTKRERREPLNDLFTIQDKFNFQGVIL